MELIENDGFIEKRSKRNDRDEARRIFFVSNRAINKNDEMDARVYPDKRDISG